jgi:hypothetical protein
MDVYDKIRIIETADREPWALPEGETVKIGVYTFQEIEVNNQRELEAKLREIPGNDEAYEPGLRAFHVTYPGSQTEKLWECARRFGQKFMFRSKKGE